MNIQFNTDRTFSVHEPFAEKLTEVISSELDRFSEYITRVEVHLSDENGLKKGVDDKRCLMEARLAGRQPIAVTEFANNYEQAVFGAVDRLKHSLDSIIEKQRSY